MKKEKSTQQAIPRVRAKGIYDDGTFYGLIYDVVFKAVFAHKKSSHLLGILLNALLRLEGDKRIKSLEILNPFNYGQFKSDKVAIVDIKARDVSGEQYCVEIQLRSGSDAPIERVLYYGAVCYVGQIKKGDEYTNLKKTVCLWIMRDKFFAHDNEIHNLYTLKNNRDNSPLTDLLEYHFIELCKFNDNMVLKTSFERWLHVLKYGDRYKDLENLPEELKQEEGVLEAINSMREANYNEKMRHTILTRNMHLSDVATGRSLAKQEGIALGEVRGQVSLIIQMIEEGYLPFNKAKVKIAALRSKLDDKEFWEEIDAKLAKL